MSRNGTLLSLGVVVLLVGLASLVATGAIGRAPPRPRATAPATAIPTLIPTPTPTAAEAPADLSGTWLGLWSRGTSNGFSTLTLTKTGNGFDGTFILSPPANKVLHVKGNLIGSTITLRTASGVVFTATLSQSTLSGIYIDVSTGKTYSWSVTLEA